jgi:hypothetical protein
MLFHVLLCSTSAPDGRDAASPYKTLSARAYYPQSIGGAMPTFLKIFYVIYRVVLLVTLLKY